jgi:hypothetical protein
MGLSLIGGDLDIKAGTLYAPDGQINLVSVASTGQVVSDFSNTTGGTITLSHETANRARHKTTYGTELA